MPPASTCTLPCGTTVCYAPEICCTSICVDLSTNLHHCGSCTNNCTSGNYDKGDGCSGGQCTCQGGSGCDGDEGSVCCPGVSSCVDTTYNDQNCGECGNECWGGQMCSGGWCS